MANMAFVRYKSVVLGLVGCFRCMILRGLPSANPLYTAWQLASLAMIRNVHLSCIRAKIRNSKPTDMFVTVQT